MNAFDQDGETSRPALTWVDGATFSVGGHTITMDYEYGGSKRESGQSDFTMMKSRTFLDQYLAHEGEDFQRIFELGVYQGGSFVFLNEVFKPSKIAAVELSEVPIPRSTRTLMPNRGAPSSITGPLRIMRQDLPRLCKPILAASLIWWSMMPRISTIRQRQASERCSRNCAPAACTSLRIGAGVSLTTTRHQIIPGQNTTLSPIWLST